MDVPEVAPWARELFGEHAKAVREGIARALRAMQDNAEAAHEDAAAKTRHVYGWARFTGQFERIWDELKGVPGAGQVRPSGSAFPLTMVGRGLLFPFRYGQTRADIELARVPSASRLTKELFSFAPEIEPEQTSLFDLLEDEEADATVTTLRAGLSSLPPDTRLVVVPYVCNVDGLLESYWGIASPGEDGVLIWAAGKPEQLVLPPAPTPRLTAVPFQPAPETTGFDQGEEPAVDLSLRSDIDRKRRDRDQSQPGMPPQSEAEPDRPQTNESDETN